MKTLKDMTFFERFEADILRDKKVITIRDASESHYQVGSVVNVSTFETGRYFCQLRILSVEPIAFSSLDEEHAKQENMTLPELKDIIRDIYPGIETLFVITYERLADS